MTSIKRHRPVRISLIALLCTAFVALLAAGCQESPMVGPSAGDEAAVADLSAATNRAHHAGPVKNFVAPLSGSQEVPAVETNATGVAKLKLSKDGAGLHYKLNVANVENVLMAHIHVAPAGANGPVAVWLYPVDGPPPQLIEGRFNGTLAEGTITATDLIGPLEGQSLDALLNEIKAGNTYVNVHTTAHPSGEIRGQIDRGNGMMP